ncbi:MAG TPA: hypothetical protein GX398_00405 [Candidatus Cloacimonetes bacterium]|nr:hypothetical protein [Candidatus Cloacimonadota bacterium]
MKRRVLIAILLSLLTFLAAASEDEFIIGAYSQYMLEYAHETEKVFTDLGKLLSDAGYNTVCYSMPHASVLDGRLEAALRALKKYNLKSIIDDWGYRANSSIGVTAMAYGNYLKLEAEYHYDARAKVYKEEKFAHDNAEQNSHNMVFRHDTGRRSEYLPDNYSNAYAWVCDAASGDKAGLVLGEPIHRWKAAGAARPNFLGPELKFYPNADRENRLYIRLALMWDDMPEDAKIAQVGLKVLNKAFEAGKDKDPYVELPLISAHPEFYDTVITNKDYAGVNKDPDTGAYIFEFYTPLFNLGSKIYTVAYDGNFFDHISPTLHWFGDGRLAVDYVELEDELHKALHTDNHPMKLALDKRLHDIDQIPNSETISHFYGKDEPPQGNFSAFNMLEKYIAEKSHHLITATNVVNANLQKAGGLPPYLHYDLFLEKAKPNTVMLDPFALLEFGAGPGTFIRWNKNFKHRLFIQNKLDSMVLDHYWELTNAVKRSPEHKDTTLLYAVQTFGEKVIPRESREWLYFMPPLNMMKCLKLLPLCYAVDGVLDFALASNREHEFPYQDDRYNRLTPIHHDENYLNPRTMEDESFIKTITETNDKIKVYGPLIKELSWEDAYCVSGRGKNKKPHSEIIKSISVRKTDNSPYHGYVQCGEYTNDEGLPTIMLVNRRAVFKKGKPGLADWKLEKEFENAPDQSVRITINPVDNQAYGLYDPYLNNLYVSDNLVFEVVLAAGDGALLQIVPVDYPYRIEAPKRSWFKRLFGIK